MPRTTTPDTLPPLHPKDVSYIKLWPRAAESYEAHRFDLWILFRAVCAMQTATTRADFVRANRRFATAYRSVRRFNDYPWETVRSWALIRDVCNRRTRTTRTA